MRHITLHRTGREWCPLCYEGERGRATHPGHFGYRGRARRGWKTCMALRRRLDGPTTDGGSCGPLDGGDLFKSWPSICEFLSMSKWPDGTSRATGTVMLLTEAGSWKVWAHDRERGEGLFCSGPTLAEALESLEKCLSDGRGDWRPDRTKSKR
jgi:hypothetical protein